MSNKHILFQAMDIKTKNKTDKASAVMEPVSAGGRQTVNKCKRSRQMLIQSWKVNSVCESVSSG